MAVQFQDANASLSETLRNTATSITTQTVTLHQLLNLIGEHALLTFCAFLCIPFLIPVSIPGVSTVFGAVIILIGIGVTLNRLPWLPAFLMNREMQSADLVPALEKGAQWLTRFDRIARRRLPLLTEVTFSGLLLMAPLSLIPFSNTLPGLAVIFLAIGLMQRDGLFILLGYLAMLASVVYFGGLALAALAAEHDLDGYRDRLASGVRSVLFLAFPTTVALVALGEPGIALVFERGAWTAEHTRATAWALTFFAIGIAGHSLLELLSRAFYALSDTITPVGVGVGSIVLNIILSLILIRVLGRPDDLSRGPFAGLALANTVATLLEAAVLWLLLRRRIGAIRDAYVLGGAVRALAAAIAMGMAIALAVALLKSNLPDVAPPIVLGVGALIGGVVFFAAAALVGLDEAVTIPRLVLRRFRR